MPAPVVTRAEQRVTTTPNATMTTLASPTLGGASSSLWTVDMPAGVVGPVHSFPDQVLWALTAGSGVLTLDGADHALTAGDCAVVPGGVPRRFAAGPEGFVAVVSTPEPGEVVREDGTSAGVPPWVA